MLRDPRDCTAFKVRRLSRQVTQFYDQALRAYGMKSTQVHLLTVVRERGPLTVGELAETIGAERTSVSRALQAAQSGGWVEVGPGADGRSKSVSLTRKAVAFLDETEPLRAELDAAVRSAVGDIVSDTFFEDLVHAADRLQEMIEEGHGR